MLNKNKNPKNIKILLTDVDGVLTNGGMYYTSEGDHMKKFHTRDGMGVTLLKKKGIPTIIVTKEKTIIVKKWAKKMKIAELYDGVIDKEQILTKICKKYKVSSSEIAYIGDDVNDIRLLKKVGYSISPKDGVKQVREIVDYVCKKNGGEGVLREIVDIMLNIKP